MSVMKRAEAGRPWMPIDAFRSFQFDRPDEERWELIDGLPVMMTPTQIGHARIAGTIERLLSEALERFDPSRIALHDIGVELGLAEETLIGLGRSAGYAPQPDVGVIDAAFDIDQRFARRLFVAVEVVSSTDDVRLTAAGMPWIEAKTRLYQAHAPCEVVLVVEQHRLEARLSHRSGTQWRSMVLTHPEAAIRFPTCGVDCRLADLYRGTPLLRDRMAP